MIDFNSLSFVPKIILITGFLLGLLSFWMLFRYTIILVIMKISPEYREFIRKTLEKKKQMR